LASPVELLAIVLMARNCCGTAVKRGCKKTIGFESFLKTEKNLKSPNFRFFRFFKNLKFHRFKGFQVLSSSIV